MKPFLVVLLGLLSTSSSTAQSTPAEARLYKSAADFGTQRLTWATACHQAPFRVRLHEWPARPYLTVVHQHQTDTLAKKAVYGYRDCVGRTYRVVDSRALPILNPTEDVLLYRVEQMSVGKTPGVVQFYFSASAAAPV